jgi:alkanesulfonate monooxygenase SsuD/methylene tetrahydromethanopterin reductase-like flavin-dependent oxidoreductase (luciferase family)
LTISSGSSPATAQSSSDFSEPDRAIAGTPDTVSERIQSHIDLGGTHFVIEFFGRDTRVPARLFAEMVVPRFR